jgi:hypothetical protein
VAWERVPARAAALAALPALAGMGLLSLSWRQSSVPAALALVALAGAVGITGPAVVLGRQRRLPARRVVSAALLAAFLVVAAWSGEAFNPVGGGAFGLVAFAALLATPAAALVVLAPAEPGDRRRASVLLVVALLPTGAVLALAWFPLAYGLSALGDLALRLGEVLLTWTGAGLLVRLVMREFRPPAGTRTGGAVTARP